MKALWSFIRSDVWPRRREILLNGQVVVVVIVLGLVAILSCGREIRIDILPEIGIGYAAIALGFTLSGALAALTLPDQAFVDALVKRTLPGRFGNAYQSLVFVFTWTAFVHWLLLLELIGLWAIFGDKSIVIAAERSCMETFVWLAALFVPSYAVLQFMVAILTVGQVAGVYASLRAKASKTE